MHPSVFSGHPKSLDEFEYSDSDIADIMTACMYNVSFLGITGQVKFDVSGEIQKNIRIEQVQGKEMAAFKKLIYECLLKINLSFICLYHKLQAVGRAANRYNTDNS